MAEKQFISQIVIGGVTYHLKDTDARTSIGDLNGVMHWIGITTTPLTDGATTSTLSIGGNNITSFANGDVVGYADKEFVFNGTKWQEFGSTGSLKALAFANTASTSYTPAGTNAASSVTLSGGSTGKLNTTTITGTNGTETVSKVSSTNKKLVTTSITGTNGTETVSKVTKTASKLVTASIVPTDGTETVSKVTKTASKLVTTSLKGVSGTLTTHDTPTLNTSNIGSASGWSAGTMTQASVSGEVLTITAGTAPSLTITSTAVGTSITAGTAQTVATANSEATTVATGSVNSEGAGSAIVTGVDISDKTVAKVGTAVTVATGSVDAEGTGSAIVTGIDISDKTVAKVADSATTVATGALDANGSGATVVDSVTATDKTVAKVAAEATTVATGSISANGEGDTVATALHTGGTAAAQTFTGTAATITVSPDTAS